MPKDKVTPAQKKIALIGLVFVLLFFCLWLFLYLPGRNTLRGLVAQLDATQNQISEIEGILGSAVTLEQGMVSLKDRDEALSSQFPGKEEGALKVFSDLAKELDIELVSIKSEPLRPFLIDKEKLRIEDSVCLCVPVLLEIKCTYGDFIKYSEALQESLPALITVEKLQITRDKGDPKELNIAINFNLYLLP